MKILLIVVITGNYNNYNSLVRISKDLMEVNGEKLHR